MEDLLSALRAFRVSVGNVIRIGNNVYLVVGVVNRCACEVIVLLHSSKLPGTRLLLWDVSHASTFHAIVA